VTRVWRPSSFSERPGEQGFQFCKNSTAVLRRLPPERVHSFATGEEANKGLFVAAAGIVVTTSSSPMGNVNCGCPSNVDTSADREHQLIADWQENKNQPIAKEQEELVGEVAGIPVEQAMPSAETAGGSSYMMDDKDKSLIEAAKKEWEEESAIRIKTERQEAWRSDLESARTTMREEQTHCNRPANRYGTDAQLPVFERGRHVPFLGLLNQLSGAMAGLDILSVCKQNDYYRDRCFNIIDVIKGQRRGGLLDVFRIELCLAKEEALALGTRPRLVSGGGDGTGSFALYIVFLALKADDERPDEGLQDTGNGFIWTDEEMAASFPAIAQMPLGSANDFANILGWGQKYPGDKKVACGQPIRYAATMLHRWWAAVIDPASKISNFDIWGIMPTKGQESCDFKLAELTGKRGTCPNEKIDGQKVLQLKEAGKPIPFFVCLYFSAGFGAYMTARFQLNRHKTPITNRCEYVRQAMAIIAESTPPQLQLRLNGVEIDCEGKPYFPPRRERGTRGRGYREVGFYNINWQAHAMHGANRAPLPARLCSSREPVMFNDGMVDMFRWKFKSLAKNPGLRVQTDKKRDMLLKYSGKQGQGVFFQWDGEARFAFSPTGDEFHIFIRKVMTIPVVLGPYHDKRLTGNVIDGQPVEFGFFGDSDDEKEKVRRRVLQSVRGELDSELNATREEIGAGSFILAEPG